MPLNYISTNPMVAAIDDRREREKEESEKRKKEDLDIAMQRGVRAFHAATPDEQPQPGQAPQQGPTQLPAQGTPMPDVRGEEAQRVPMPGVRGEVAQGTPMAAPSIQQPAIDQNTQMMNSLSGTPGAGKYMMELQARNQQLGQAASQTEVDQRNKIADQVVELLRSNDVTQLEYAKDLAARNGIQVPPELFDNALVRARFLGILDVAKTVTKDPQQRAEYMRGVSKQAQQGGNFQQQVSAGLDAMPKPQAKLKKIQEDNSGNVWSVYDDGTTKQLLEPGGKPIRYTKDAKQYEFERKIELFQQAYPGTKLSDALEWASAKSQLSVAEARPRVFTALSKMENDLGEPIYATPEEMYTATEEAVRRLGFTGGGGGGNRIQFDAQGNRVQ